MCRHAFRPPTEHALYQLWFSENRSAIKVSAPRHIDFSVYQCHQTEPDQSLSLQRFFPAPLPATLRLLQKDGTFTDVRNDDHDGDNTDRVDTPTTRAPHDLAVACRTYTDTHPQGRLANLGEWWGAFELGTADEVEEGGENGQEEGRVGAGGGKDGVAKKRKRGADRGGSGDSEAEEESSEDEDDEDEDEDEGPERRKQARFLRAVGDLAHLGFIHPTTYKAEHVLKSVY